MGDLVERLRTYRPYRIGDGEWFGPKMCEEAADELTALRAQVSQLTADLEVAVGALEQIADDPYQHGQRIQKMKHFARATLSTIRKDG